MKYVQYKIKTKIKLKLNRNMTKASDNLIIKQTKIKMKIKKSTNNYINI